MALNDLDQNSRFEKSLGLLTTRFVNLLQDAEDGVLDLKVVSIIFRPQNASENKDHHLMNQHNGQQVQFAII